jgi:hypothetical protein
MLQRDGLSLYVTGASVFQSPVFTQSSASPSDRLPLINRSVDISPSALHQKVLIARTLFQVPVKT